MDLTTLRRFLIIKVLPPDSKQSIQREGGAVASNNVQINAENIFVRSIVSKTTIKEQEVILLTYKVYYKVDLVNITDVKLPDFEGFMTHDIDVLYHFFQ